MLSRIGSRFESFFRATAPDPFVLAVALTALTLGLAVAVEGVGPLVAIRAWQGESGFWSLLAFSMQMVLILVTGHALASTGPVRSLIRRLAAWPRTGGQAAALVAFVAIACALLNWGLGLIVGALLARDVGRSCARRGVAVHYPLLVAAGYSGMMCWHGGFSGTAPLKVTTAADLTRFLGPELAHEIQPIPFTETVLGTSNLIVTGGLLLLVPALAYRLSPAEGVVGVEGYAGTDEDTRDVPAFGRNGLAGLLAAAAALLAAGWSWLTRAVGTTPVLLVIALAITGAAVALAHGRQAEEPADTVPERLERSPWMMAVAGVPLSMAVVRYFVDVGVAGLEPNGIDLIFLTAGLLLHGSLARYAKALGEATSGAAGIILQFPFYAGIMGVMRATGLARDAATWLADAAPRELYTSATFLSAGALNLFVPSGGGQWAVQGPIAVTAARELGGPLSQAVMAVAYGDQWTNMLQPFWALPLLAITGIRARDILGYTALFMLAGGAWVIACLIAFSMR